MSRSARWCFTKNNPLQWRPEWLPMEMDYLIWEHEIGEQGTPHIQGYVRFKIRKTLQAAKRLIHPESHLEPARGSEGDSIIYCSKDRTAAGDDWAEIGVPDPNIKQGRRTDLEDVINDVNQGLPQRYFSIPNL